LSNIGDAKGRNSSHLAGSRHSILELENTNIILISHSLPLQAAQPEGYAKGSDSNNRDHLERDLFKNNIS
jgi:hypothetical protein